MVKDLRKPKAKMSEEDKLIQNWLSMAPSKAEIRKIDYWFERLKTEMYGDTHHPGNIKQRWSLLITRMIEMFPQYEHLQNGRAHTATTLYKSLWRHFQRLLAKWNKDSPQKLRKSPRALSQMSTEDSMKN